MDRGEPGNLRSISIWHHYFTLGGNRESSPCGSWGTASRRNFRASRGTCCYTVCKHGEEQVFPVSELLVSRHEPVVASVPHSYWNSSTAVSNSKPRCTLGMWRRHPDRIAVHLKVVG